MIDPDNPMGFPWKARVAERRRLIVIDADGNTVAVSQTPTIGGLMFEINRVWHERRQSLEYQRGHAMEDRG